MKIWISINLLLISMVGLAAPADDFVITVQTDAAGTDLTSFIITTLGGGYNYNVDCNDDGVDEATAQTGDYTCEYAGMGGAGTYTIRIKDNSGTGEGFPRFVAQRFIDNPRKIMSLDQWGTGRWTSMVAAFGWASNMVVLATDVPNFDLVTDMEGMFLFAELANPDVSGWDVSSVTNMGGMFSNAISANPDVSNWDVSSVTDMGGMFFLATSANPDVSNWDVSSVTDMRVMFTGAESADPDVSGWDVSLVTDMEAMFRRAVSANPDVSGWNVSSVTTMSSMFSIASLANPDVSGWDVSSVTDMSFMFQSARSAEPDLSNWNVTALLDASDMFQGVTLTTVTYDALLNSWGNQVLQNNVPFSAGNSRFCNSAAARSTMINTYGWSITDSGLGGCSVDVAITKTLDTAAPYVADDSIEYNLVVSNNGPDTATDVLITDTPSNLTIVTVNSTNCTAMPCTIASMANGATENITIVATINTIGAFDNSASAFATDEDPDIGNNTDGSGNGGTATMGAPVSVPTLSPLMLLSLLVLVLIFTKYFFQNRQGY